MLPAKQGDALWIEYGTKENVRRILIDGGPIAAYATLEKKVSKLPADDKGVELVVISHVDTDHIEGIIRLLAAKRNDWPIRPKDIWFNGWQHLQESEILGGREGDFLSALLAKRAGGDWNRAFDKKAVVVEAGAQPPVKKLKDGMKLTLLSPQPEKLKEMAAKWTKDVEKHRLKPGDLEKAWEQLVEMKKYKVVKGVLGGTDDISRKLTKQLKTDQSAANGTSIAFLAQFGKKSCLFLADAHTDVLCAAIKKLVPKGQRRLKVDAVKISHHGSRHNISAELMNLIDAQHFLISTDGSIHEHPDKEAMETILVCSRRSPQLWFNYRSQQNAEWAKSSAKSKHKFTAHYPQTGEEGIAINL